jgi:hypothetical protein
MLSRKMPALRLLLPLICYFCVFAVTATGCGKTDPNLAQVEGSVMVGNKPLTTGTVIFYPDATKGNDSKDEPRSPINTNGRYHLQNGVKQGITPGWYKVAVTAADQIDPKNPYFTNWLIPTKYIDPKTSKLRLEVVATHAPGAYNITLEPKP